MAKGFWDLSRRFNEKQAVVRSPRAACLPPAPPMRKGHPCGCSRPSEASALPSRSAGRQALRRPLPGDAVVASSAQPRGRPRSAPTSSGTGCWCPGGRCHGTGRRSPWRRPPGPCSSSSVCPSAETGAHDSAARQHPRLPLLPCSAGWGQGRGRQGAGPDPTAPSQLTCSPPTSRAGGVRQSEGPPPLKAPHLPRG